MGVLVLRSLHREKLFFWFVVLSQKRNRFEFRGDSFLVLFRKFLEDGKVGDEEVIEHSFDEPVLPFTRKYIYSQQIAIFTNFVHISSHH